jgi:ribosomal protein S18 acetylase RimI-like enzyme
LEIIRATADMAGTLTNIAFAAKRHWGYPERWITIWTPLLTVSVQYIENHDTYVAWEAGGPVGFYAICVDKSKSSLEHFWVHPESMGKGIGRRLFLHALSSCRAQQMKLLVIESDPNAQGFYEKMGARQIGEVFGEVEGLPRTLPVMEITPED